MTNATPPGMRLYPYQDDGQNWLFDHKNALLADEMGLGKTVQAIALANRIAAVRILIVCPSSLKSNWKRELETWLTAPLSIGIVKGSVLPEADVVVVNYDVLDRHSKKLAETTWDLVVFDESHYLKNPDAKRTKAALWTGFKGRKIFLSGTPVESRPIELWPILFSLDRRAWGAMHDFGLRYCNAKEMVVINRMRPEDWAAYRMFCSANHLQGGPRLPLAVWERFSQVARPQAQVRRMWDYSGASNLEELSAKLKPFMLRRLKADVLKDLPPKTRQIIELPADGCSKALKHEAEQFAAIVAKLKAGVPVDFDECTKARHETALAKLPQAIEFIKNALESSEKIIVFAHHRDVLEALHAAFEDSALLYGGMSDAAKDEQVKKFKTTAECRVFIGSIMAAGAGLTLTEASLVIFVEADWLPGKLSQAEDRAHRIGQLHDVLVQHLVLEGSMDAQVLTKIVRKQAIITTILDGAPSDTASWADDLLALDPT